MAPFAGAVYKGQSQAAAAQCRSLLSSSPAMLPGLIFLLGLPLTLAAPTCAPLIPVTFDNATIPRLLGHWIYIAGASRYPPHLEELRALKHAAFSFSPSSHEDELDVTEIMRLNETCLERNSSKVLVFRYNSTLAHVDGQVFATAKLIQSDKDLLILNHLNDDFPSLSLSARTPNVSKEQLEEFRSHLHCLGFTEEDIFITSEKDACPLPWEKKGEGDAEPQLK
ncbi:alpha-1-acid glycoprotein 1-like [Pezoporus wallicus]|uniref:alpha-1-acid glycoprotein 1-like n=1 Tax=Pezoporus wallicus TaxID=35540 RepID=UPI00254A2265|nr:alpha-1-acid glycoprotein 1-like [Pezoporus wallicus]